MKCILLALPIFLLAPSPAHATGGFVCRTAGARPIEVSIGFGHVAGAALLQDAIRLTENGRNIPATAPQWWFDGAELRLLLTDKAGLTPQAMIKAQYNGRTYDGSLWRHGRQQWVRCREG